MRLLLGVLCLLSIAAGAEEAIYDTRAQRWLTLPELAQAARGGDIFIFGEQHATADDPETAGHHENQIRFLQTLRGTGASVSVGMEFLEYPAQGFVY